MGVNITTIVYLRVFNHPNWVNHYFNGGGSPGYIYIRIYIYTANSCIKMVRFKGYYFVVLRFRTTKKYQAGYVLVLFFLGRLLDSGFGPGRDWDVVACKLHAKTEWYVDNMKALYIPGDSKWHFHPLVGGHLSICKGHLTNPKRSQRIARYIRILRKDVLWGTTSECLILKVYSRGV